MIPLNIASRKSSKEDKQIYHLVIAHQERLDFDQICKLIAERTTLSEHEVEFALSELQDIIIENLTIGRGVELGRLGRLEPSINVKSVDNMLIIQADNYFVGNIKFDSDGLPITSKEDKNYHGFGIQSIKLLVEKYNGTLTTYVSDEIFHLNILFNLNNVQNK